MYDRGIDGTVIGPNARSQRKALGLPRAEVARRARVSASWLSELEKGAGIRVTADQCYRLAAALGCRMEDLLGLPYLASVDDARLHAELDAARQVIEEARHAVGHLAKLAEYLRYEAPEEEGEYLAQAIRAYDAVVGARGDSHG